MCGRRFSHGHEHHDIKEMSSMMVTILIFLAFKLMFLYHSIVIVRPGERIVLWKRFTKNEEVTNRMKVLNVGVHFINWFSWSVLSDGPFQGLVASNACPVPSSIVALDPDKVEITSKDQVPGTANVALELRVLDWEPSDIIGVNVPYRLRACTTVNQWVSKQLSMLDAATLSSYSQVVSCLNDESALRVLNESLKDYFLEAKRVSVDSSGIQLHKDYVATVGKAIQNMRQITLQRQEVQAAQEALENKLKLQQMEVASQCEAARAQSQVDREIERAKAEVTAAKATALLSCGLTSQQVANVLIAEVSVSGLSKAQRVVVGMPPGLLGLLGADHVHAPASRDSDAFEKI